jgi:GTP-binding protein Era
MMNYVKVSLEDADLILLLVDPAEKYDPLLFDKLNRTETPVILVINKADLGKGSQVEDKATYWKEHLPRVKTIIPVSALRGDNVPELLNIIVDNLPEHPAYFPVDELTDRPQRFFASEILREKIFLNYEQEVPYSTEVVITDFIEQDGVLRIRAEIFVERDSQKGIIIGKAGSALKKVGTEARQSMEEFFQTRVFLETKVKVAKNWRREQGRLKQFGYGL